MKTENKVATVPLCTRREITPYFGVGNIGAGVEADMLGRTYQGENSLIRSVQDPHLGGMEWKQRYIKGRSDLQCIWLQHQVKGKLILLSHCGCSANRSTGPLGSRTPTETIGQKGQSGVKDRPLGWVLGMLLKVQGPGMRFL